MNNENFRLLIGWSVVLLLMLIIFGFMYLMIKASANVTATTSCIQSNKTYINACSKPEAFCIQFCGNLDEIKDIVAQFRGIGE